MRLLRFAHLQWVRLSILAKHLGISLDTARRLVARGVLKAVRIATRHYTDDRPRKTERATWYVEVGEAERFLRLYRAGTFS